ncbi:hypothetical protein ACFV3E_24615 [Streptomyces sp. NPDC059718]
MTDEERPRRATFEECPDCHAGPSDGDARVIMAGRSGVTETWHTAECPGHLVQRILIEDGVQRMKEREARATLEFPAAHERLKTAAHRAKNAPPTAAGFVAAFSELVQNHANGRGGCYSVADWVDLINKHIAPPAEGPPPGS